MGRTLYFFSEHISDHSRFFAKLLCTLDVNFDKIDMSHKQTQNHNIINMFNSFDLYEASSGVSEHEPLSLPVG